MTNLYQNKYRVATARAKWHDYKGGIYFVTICTQHKKHYFGEIYNDEMHLTAIGQYVEQQIQSSQAKRADMNLDIPLYVIMPNHVHMLIYFGGPLCCEEEANSFAPQSKNLASVIRGIKSAVTSYAAQNDIPFEWQPRYHEHIVQSEHSLNVIAQYIGNNVAQWSMDCFY